MVITNEQNDKYYIYSLTKKYNQTVAKIETDETDEILETLSEIEELDRIYNQIVEFGNNIMSKTDFDNYKSNLLQQRIQKKFYKYLTDNEKIELLKSLKDELIYCKKRFPQYEKIFDIELLKIENILS